MPRESLTRRGFVGGSMAAAASLTPAASASAGQDPAPPSVPGAESGPGPAPESTAPPPASPGPAPTVISGILPQTSVAAGLRGPRSESGIGALMPWGGRLWFVTYTAHTARSGSETGLFYLDEHLARHRHPASVVGTYANRFVHRPSEQMMIGPHLVDADNTVRTVDDLAPHRLTATLAHPRKPGDHLLVLGMEGELWELNVQSLAVRQLADLVAELKIPADLWPHFKGGFTVGQEKVIVANNTYNERDHLLRPDQPVGGRLAEWDGGDGPWTILEHTAFNEVAGRPGPDHAQALAVGWDRASVILRLYNRGQWSRYRLPKASHAFDHGWYTEWPRIREVETERFLLDAHGQFYELSPLAYAGRLWGVKPISQHLRMIPDFCSWKGLLVLAGDHATAVNNYELVGEPQSNLWFGATDDLWAFGPPQGWGGPWWESPVEPQVPSDPYLMTGFAHKGLHLANHSAHDAHLGLEVDFRGDGAWMPCKNFSVDANSYLFHSFERSFSAHWVRLVPLTAATLTAQFVYT